MSTFTDTTATISPLALPVTLPNGASIKNRLVKAAMNEQLAGPANQPTAELARVYRRWAHGGAGLLITGNVMIDRRSIGEPLNVVVEDGRDFEPLEHWADAAKSDGATALVQINHPGRQTLAGLSELAVAPSAVQVDMGPTFAKPRALTAEEILELIARFASTARTVVEAGFDGVQIHAAHGYLINQFLSPRTNRRDDDWGRDPGRRRRFLVEVTRAVRAAIGPDNILAIKLNSADFQRGGFTEEESLAAIEQLDRENIDLLEISGGTYESPAMSDGGTSESTRRREVFFLDFAERVRNITTIPLLVTGGFRTGAGMTDAITSGATDLIGIARPLALQPGLPMALLASPDTARSDFELKKIGIKKLDSVADLWWTQHQVQRLGVGKDADPTYSPRRAVLDALKRDGRNILRRRRGA
jgi:2,4-dienoyl-CoA reductase-like NADH-dependent reductase (Old Yellow Enzyme family)